MNKGDELTLTIEDMSVEGQGIGRPVPGESGGAESEDASSRGPVVFVDGAVKGDLVRARIGKVKKRFAFAKAIEILEESTLRNRDFDCPGKEAGCGGCPLAELDYEAQLQLKEKQVRDRLMRIAEIENPMVNPIIGMKEEDNDGQGPYRYRNKAAFPVSTGGIITRKGGIVESLGSPEVGFYRGKSHEVVDCYDCYIQSLAAVAAADALRCFMEEDNITGFDPRWEKGLIRHLIVKTAVRTGEVMVILVINGKGIPGASKLVAMMDEAIAGAGCRLESVVLNIHKASGKNVEKNKHKKDEDVLITDGMLGDEYVTIAGKNTIVDRIGELQVEISPDSFFQVNPVQMERLYHIVREYCRMEKRPVILDLYCGIGSIGLYCADLSEMIIGIESVKSAVLDANRNAVINGIVNARYLCGRAEEILPAYLGDGKDVESFDEACSGNTAGRDITQNKSSRAKIRETDPQLEKWIRRADVAILDPPRAGCRQELLDAVAFAQIPRIIYVSCDPATLARDVKRLRELGYAFVEATPVDMFPHTGHVETVALIQKRKSN